MGDAKEKCVHGNKFSPTATHYVIKPKLLVAWGIRRGHAAGKSRLQKTTNSLRVTRLWQTRADRSPDL